MAVFGLDVAMGSDRLRIIIFFIIMFTWQTRQWWCTCCRVRPSPARRHTRQRVQNVSRPAMMFGRSKSTVSGYPRIRDSTTWEVGRVNNVGWFSKKRG